MDIINFQVYKDGGTIEIITTEGVFSFDKRLNTTTENELYNGYPKSDNSNLINNSTELKNRIIERLKDFEDEDYQPQIDSFIEEITK